MERSTFEIFKSNICHSVKDMGELAFIREVLCSQMITEYYEKEWYAESLYLLAMVDYLSRKNDIPLYNKYDVLRSCKLDKVLYPSSVLMLYQLSKDENVLKNSFENAIPEFKRFNIVENNVNCVV